VLVVPVKVPCPIPLENPPATLPDPDNPDAEKPPGEEDPPDAEEPPDVERPPEAEEPPVEELPPDVDEPPEVEEPPDVVVVVVEEVLPEVPRFVPKFPKLSVPKLSKLMLLPLVKELIRAFESRGCRLEKVELVKELDGMLSVSKSPCSLESALAVAPPFVVRVVSIVVVVELLPCCCKFLGPLLTFNSVF